MFILFRAERNHIQMVAQCMKLSFPNESDLKQIAKDTLNILLALALRNFV